MKTTFLLGLAAAALAAPALAQSTDVSVRVSDDLRRTAEEKYYGQRDLDRLAADLERRTEQALERSGRTGGRFELELSDARPSSPTFEELGRRPGLSQRSIYLGGAEIEGEYVAPDGARSPVRYGWYESDIRNNVGAVPWSDAERAIDRFAGKVSRGELPNRSR